ncbi:MAG: hypothetical protein CVV44_03900 [Spirochaetae bacterium HGW-Spirochaetae-1]|jgi:hypothetical protein|nr:MAG: hypothetical protein CVV44_03900 [Spirochaetae bacterium HGW-Spirochaetae-1]
MALPATGYDLGTISNPSSALTDFTFIVDLSRMSSSWWADVDSSDGTRGRAAMGDGTELACDWIDFDNSGETGLLRVKWSGTLASSGTQQVRIYPPNTRNAAVSDSDTYGSDNAYDSYHGWYFPTPLDADRIAGVTATGYNTPSEVSGLIGSAVDFDDASSEYIDTDSDFSVSGDWTASVLVHIDDADAAHGIMGSGWRWFMGNDGYNYLRIDGSFEYINTGAIYGDWHTLSFSYTYLSGNLAFYLDGGLVDDYARTSEMSLSGEPLNMGRERNGGTSYMDGRLQHVSIDTAVRSAAWHAHESDQLLDNATFWGTWAWQSGGSSYNCTLSESLSTSDALASQAVFGASMSDEITISDSDGARLEANGTLADSLNISDNFISAAILNAVLADSLSVGDFLGSLAILKATLSEMVPVVDALVSTALFTGTLSESLTITDFISYANAIFLTLSDSIGISDSCSASATFMSTLAETLNVSDELRGAAEFKGTLSEAVTITDIMQSVAQFTASLSESMSITDAIRIATPVIEVILKALILQKVSHNAKIMLDKVSHNGSITLNKVDLNRRVLLDKVKLQ